MRERHTQSVPDRESGRERERFFFLSLREFIKE